MGKLDRSIGVYLVALLLFPGGPLALATDEDVAVIEGHFQCGRGNPESDLPFNCGNAYIHAINFSGHPHINSMADIKGDGHFRLEVPLVKMQPLDKAGRVPSMVKNLGSVSVANEMTFIVRSIDEDRTLGIFYRPDDQIDGGLNEAFFIGGDHDFGWLRIRKGRYILAE